MPAAVRAQSAAPGAAAPEPVTRELQQALAAATERFQALDAAGVLGHVSEQYRNGPFTKAAATRSASSMPPQSARPCQAMS